MSRLARNGFLIGAGAIFAGAFALSCSPSQPAPADSPNAQLWGDMTSVVSVKQLMRDMIDPIADNIFDAVGSEMTDEGGLREWSPTTDEDWDKVRVGAVTMIEGSYLLKVPRVFATPEEGSDADTAPPEEGVLDPDEMLAKRAEDPVLWDAKIEALRNVGLEVLDIVKRRDTDELFAAGEDLDLACEGCHLDFWYPGEKAFLEELDRRLRESTGTSPSP